MLGEPRFFIPILICDLTGGAFPCLFLPLPGVTHSSFTVCFPFLPLWPTPRSLGSSRWGRRSAGVQRVILSRSAVNGQHVNSEFCFIPSRCHFTPQKVNRANVPLDYLDKTIKRISWRNEGMNWIRNKSVIVKKEVKKSRIHRSGVLNNLFQSWLVYTANYSQYKRKAHQHE